MKKKRALKAVILAGGRSMRMKSIVPKPLIDLCGQPMMGYVLDALKAAGIQEIAVVTNASPQGEKIKAYAKEKGAKIFVQTKSLGTAHAVLAAEDFLTDTANILILCADTPLIKASDLQLLIKEKNNVSDTWSGSFLAMSLPANQHSFGILNTALDDEILSITEASERPLNTTAKPQDLCNSGICLLNGKYALTLLKKIKNQNRKKEYFLTDYPLVSTLAGLKCTAVVAQDNEACLGVNTATEFAHVSCVLQQRWRYHFMSQGVHLLAPDTLFFSYDTSIAPGAIIEPNVILGPKTIIEKEVRIKAFSYIEGAHIKSKSVVGPYARLRPDTILEEKTKIGNFVEIKKSHLKENVKVSHLSYIGDTLIESNANIGAGVITCNYDGTKKHKTYIDKGAFIGSNTALIAPVKIGKNAVIGAGSTITEDVQDNALSLTRAPQKFTKDFNQKKKGRK